jgi:hypothetical protein
MTEISQSKQIVSRYYFHELLNNCEFKLCHLDLLKRIAKMFFEFDRFILLLQQIGEGLGTDIFNNVNEIEIIDACPACDSPIPFASESCYLGNYAICENAGHQWGFISLTNLARCMFSMRIISTPNVRRCTTCSHVAEAEYNFGNVGQCVYCSSLLV